MKTAEDLIDWAVNKMHTVNNPIELMIRNTKAFESNIRKDERLKIATKFSELSIEQITDIGTIYKTILKS